MRKHYWQRWHSTDYLHALQLRTKWYVRKHNLKIGDLVLITNERNLPPFKWKIGRITEVHQGQNNF